MVMTHEEIAAMQADALAGTPGDWFVSGVRFKMNNSEWQGIMRYDDALKRDENIAAVGYDPRTGLGWPDARRIARLPRVEAAVTALTVQAEADQIKIEAQEVEIARLTEINRKLCADFNLMNQHGARQDAAIARLRDALMDTDRYLDKGLDKMARNITRAALVQP